jgi:hypothetical protein
LTTANCCLMPSKTMWVPAKRRITQLARITATKNGLVTFIDTPGHGFTSAPARREGHRHRGSGRR